MDDTISPCPRDEWRELMGADPEALPYQSPEWTDSICATGGYFDASRLFRLEDGARFVMPLVVRTGRPTIISTAASLPSAWGIGGVIGTRRPEASDIRAIFEQLNKLPYGRVIVRPNPRNGARWSAAALPGILSRPRRAHVLDLEGGFEKVWAARFSKSTRSRIRKAERLGVTVEYDTRGKLVPVFFELLQKSFERWSIRQNEPLMLTRLRGAARDPLRKFQAIAAQMGEACQVWVARVGGRPAAAAIVLQGKNVNDSRAAMDRDLAAGTGANDLLLKSAIEHACARACRYYHMGESGQSASLAEFKERFGAIAYDYAEYYLEKLPYTRLDMALRTMVKQAIGFRDA